MRAVVLVGSAALGDYVPGVSDLDVAVISPGRVDVELDLNTGADGERLLTSRGDEPGHWYLIDLAIAHEYGVSLAGPPAQENALRARRFAESGEWVSKSDVAAGRAVPPCGRALVEGAVAAVEAAR